MNCTQTEQYLDAMMDGTLDAEALARLEAHCRECPACAEKLKVNRQMMRVFAEMAPEMDVPLTAQAAWRSAVKRESGKVRQRRAFRYVGGIAAALVVALGATFALRTNVNRNSMAMLPAAMEADYADSEAAAEDAPEAESAVTEGAMEAERAATKAAVNVEANAVSDAAFIEADGAAEAPMMFSASEPMAAEEYEEAMESAAPMREIVMVVEDVDRVCSYAQDLALEYGGDIDIQHFEESGVACANVYIDLPSANAADYIEAIRHFDRSGAPLDAFGLEGETSILLVLKAE